jgi:hypothetical protein
MDNFLPILAGGGVSGMVFFITYLIFKYLETHKILIVSGCCRVKLEEDRTPPPTIITPLLEE